MPSAQKLDLYKQHKADFAAPKTPKLVEIAPAGYLSSAGRGQPGSEVFTTRIQCLYGVAYTIKMARKAAGRDYVVCKLEGLWWSDDAETDFTCLPPEQWSWKMLIRVPEFVTPGDLDDAVAALREKGKPPEVADVRLERIDEGRCVQMLHVGPYSSESETIAVMTAFAEGQGLTLHGQHHEIYLSDPRRVPEQQLRTILRHPVQ